MKKQLIIGLSLLCCLGTSSGHAAVVTLYADGAQVELEASAVRGTVEIPLPANMIADSLRIKPVGSAVIQRVERLQAPPVVRGKEKEQETLLEQKNRLIDRLKALDTREQIFTAAAKSQSGKAPRKTKANPDPMQSIRQGTDFAIAQLEAVYTSRRRTEQELKRIETRLAAGRHHDESSAGVARVTLAPPRGSVVVRYGVSGDGWIPRYDLHLAAGGTAARLDLRGDLPAGYKGFKRLVALGNRTESAVTRPVAASASSLLLAQYQLAVSDQLLGRAGEGGFSFVVQNQGKQVVPAGDATVYLQGEYVGQARFEALSSGRSRRITSGR